MILNRCACGRFIRHDQIQCDKCQDELAKMVYFFTAGLILVDIVKHPEEFKRVAWQVDKLARGDGTAASDPGLPNSGSPSEGQYDA